MTSFGKLLEEARTSRAVTLDAVARETRIARRYLEALERDDVDRLPGRAFAKGYIRAYAQCLGADPAPMLEAFEAQTSGTGETDVLEVMHRLAASRPARRPSLLLRAMPIAAAGAALLAAAWWWASPDEAAPPPAASAMARSRIPAPEPEVASSTTTSAPAVRQEPESTSQISVPGHGVGADVVDRKLVGRGERFREGDEVWFWTLVANAEPGTSVRHVWLHEGERVMMAKLPVGSTYWRTYSRLVLPRGSAGRWAVEVRTEDGRALARDDFDCVASQAN